MTEHERICYGLFTLLLQDFGVKGVQVEEIYDLQKPIEGPTYGFIFLFRWIEERRSRRKTITEEETFVTEEDIVNSIFFAQQMIPNSCATHALLSVLLNCEKVNLGDTLSKLKAYCRKMSPENKGYAIGNIPELAKAHNSHARQEPSQLPEKQQGMTVRTMETFHFVSYVPIHGRLFELDGLKPYPIDHGPWDTNEDWTEKFRRVISERLGMATGGEPYHDIRFNLMAVVPDKVSLYEQKLSTLKTNRQIVLEALQQMVKVSNPSITLAEKEKCLAAVKKRGQSPTTHISVKSERKSNQSPHVTFAESRKHVRIKKEKQEPIEIDLTEDELEKEKAIRQEVPMDVSQSVGQDNVTSGELVQIKVEDDVALKTSVKIEQSVDTAMKMTTEIEPAQLDTVSGVPLPGSVTGDSSVVRAGVAVTSTTQNNALGVVTTTGTTTDVTKPLTIETKFSVSPGPSSESTDTASEVGSCFSSPSSSIAGTSAQNSPEVSSGDKVGERSPSRGKVDADSTPKSKTRFSSQQGFRPKDLIALLKNVENEINSCETKLQDEQEKIKKYKIDDCRRTHNYDQFLCTFLSMLAEQGHLAELVQQHSFIKKRVPGHISNKLKKLTQDAKRKRNKPKRKR